MKKRFLLATFSILLIAACSKDLKNNDRLNDYRLEKGDFTFLKNTDLYAEAKADRSDNYSEEFEIDKVERVGDSLSITVSYRNDCETNNFEIIWDGTIMESYPEMTIFFVKRTTDGCGGTGSEEIQILSLVLTEIIEDTALAKRISVIVSNASKKAATENADVVVSNKN